MYINNRIMAGHLNEDAIQHPPASNGNVCFQFQILQPRATRFADGTSGVITERAWCRFWCHPKSLAYHASKLRKGSWVIVEGDHQATKRQKGDETVTYHEIELSAPPQYVSKGKAPPYINRHILVGNLGRDARFFPPSEKGNVKVVFSTASTKYRKGSDGQGQEVTLWLDHVLFIVQGAQQRYQNMLTKGATVWVEGRHDVVKREIEGATKYFPEILVRDVKAFEALESSSTTVPDEPSNKPRSERPRAEDEHKSAFQPASFDL